MVVQAFLVTSTIRNRLDRILSVIPKEIEEDLSFSLTGATETALADPKSAILALTLSSSLSQVKSILADFYHDELSHADVYNSMPQ